MRIQYVIGTILIVLSFQNCAEPINTDDYTNQPSSTTPPVTPTVPPTPPPAPTATTVTIIDQSLASISLESGQTLNLYIAPAFSPTSAASTVVYEWKQGSAVVASGPTATNAYQKTAVVLGDSGNYQVFVKDAITNAVLAQSQVFTVTVTTPSPVEVTYNPATISSGAHVFYFSVGTAGFAQTAAAFCKVKLGANATLVSSLKTGAKTSSVYQFWILAAANCASYTASYGHTPLGYDLCGVPLFPVTAEHYSLTCRAN